MMHAAYIPDPRLRPYVRQILVSENEAGSEYQVFPLPGVVIGFQYRGALSLVGGAVTSPLAAAGVTGITTGSRIFRSAPYTGSVLVYFTEPGFAHFTAVPVHELLNRSLALDELFGRPALASVQDQLERADADATRIRIVEDFLLRRLRDVQTDKLVVEAVRLINASRGTIRIGTLSEQLFTSRSPLEKRFRAVVGASPKTFASIVRFNAVLDSLHRDGSLTGIAYDNRYFDQSHFIREFSRFSGSTPEQFRKGGK